MLELRAELTAAGHQMVGAEAQVSCQMVLRSELLQLPTLDLLERLRAEAEENPALELEITWPTEPAVSAGMPPAWGGRGLAGHDAPGDVLARAAAPYDLRDELHRRLAWSADGCGARIAGYLIECLDERGYLTTTILDAARELRVAPAEVEAALRTVQAIAPPGVGARDLRECLLLQLAALPDLPPTRRATVERWVRGLQAGDERVLSCQGLLTDADLAETLALVRALLVPYPGLQFRAPWSGVLRTTPAPPPPDVVLSRAGDEIVVEVATSRMVSVRVAAAYEQLDRALRGSVECSAGEAEAREQVRSARRLIWSLQQRERSLHRVARAITLCQREFLLHGPLHHRPLTHRRIAELTGLHESTVCRATAGKLVQLPGDRQGSHGECTGFEVFFDDALPARTILRELIDEEDPRAPRTDAELQALLRERGLAVARRTVNKYRRALGIPSAAERARPAA